ncbi:DUF4019 domain-containing protein [bacterium]|nr:DUF4019 domain-containing protein [bacterium]
MTVRIVFALTFFALLFSAPGSALDPAAPAPKQAVADWLALVDAGKYGASWDAAGDLLQDQISRDGWIDGAPKARKPLGALQSRTINFKQAAETLPGAPDGDYRIYVTEATFARKASGAETVTVVREGDTWKVVGYFVR